MSVTVLAITLIIGVRLFYTTIRVGVRTRARRPRTGTSSTSSTGATIHRRIPCSPGCPHDRRRHSLAYCLPGLRQRVVISEGVVARLSEDELRAVLAHERAHLRARHDLVLEAFIALHEAFPRFVRSKSALGAVELLVEALADDQAVAATTPPPRPGARRLRRCGRAAGAMAVGGPTTLTRVHRLRDPRSPRWVSAAAYTTAAAILVVPTLAVAIPWLTELSRLFCRVLSGPRHPG